MAKKKTYKFEDIVSEIHSGKFHPVYFLFGEESYFIDEIEKALLDNVLTEQEKAFNLSILYGKDIDTKKILDHAAQYPMMAKYRLVIVREAQTLKDLGQLLPYLKNPVETTILVLEYKKEKVDGRTAFGKAVKVLSLFFESKQLRDYEVPKWLLQKFKRLEYDLAPDAAEIIAEHTGTSIAKIMNELNKLFLNIPKGTRITTQHVKKYIGISRQISIFELVHAIAQAQKAKTFKLIKLLEAQDSSGILPLSTSLLYRHFSQLMIYHQHKNNGMSDYKLAGTIGVNPYFIKDIKRSAERYSPNAIRRIFIFLLIYDLKAKGVDTWHMPSYGHLKELCTKILMLSR